MSLFYLFVALCSFISITNITININSIIMLNRCNFKSWQDNRLIVLAVMDLDFMLSVDSPPPLKDKGTADDKRKIERWERSNYIVS